MRIIGGALKRRQLGELPRGVSTRPMPDHVREAIFNLLRGHAEGETVLDLFAGSGAVGFEALSRGAARCVFIERDQRVARVIERTARELGVADRATVIVGDAMSPGGLARVPGCVHLAFFDPPYALVSEPEAWQRTRRRLMGVVDLLDETGYAVFRTPWPFRHHSPDGEAIRPDLSLDNAEGPETHAYGSTAVHLYMRREASEGGPASQGPHESKG